MSKARRSALVVTLVFFIALLCFVIAMNVKNNQETRAILEDSVETQLISVSMAARQIIDTDAFMSYNSVEDVQADQEAYNDTLLQLRNLSRNIGAEYIYALKMIDGEAMFVFDTDPVDDAIFVPYTLTDVHKAAFSGEDAAQAMDVSDAYGSFSTGAVPIWQGGRVVGIVCADIEDEYLISNKETTQRNTLIMISVLVLTMAVMLVFTFLLLKRIGKMQKKLEKMAHHDSLTGLPNRAFLLDYLAEITSGDKRDSFALFFIDLDNFKMVNDGAGHDAGDELLRHIATYLEGALHNSVAFRPSPGILNIAARIGGDEFIQVVSGIETPEQANEMAQKLLDGFKDISIDRYISNYNVGLSIGIALYPYHTENFHVLIKYADIAMYHAKESGKNTYRLYEDSMSQMTELG